MLTTVETPVEAYQDFTFQVEPMATALRDGLREVHKAHFAETEKFRESEGVNPDYERYMDMERKGQFLLFTVRDAEYNLVGDAMVIVHRNRHTQKLSSVEDALYVAPSARKGWVAVKFVKFIIRHLKHLGVTQMSFGCKMSNDISAIYERCGLMHTAKVYSMVVSDAHAV